MIFIQFTLKYCEFHFYPDDFEIYLHFKIGNIDRGVENINYDLKNISLWVKKIGLYINREKTKTIIFGYSQ